MDSILSTYLKEMSEFLLTDNFTLEDRRWAIVVRAKTLTVFRQLDGKRKSQAIQFLFEAQLLTYNKHPIDLKDADLNDIDMSDRRLDSISLSGASLHNAKFIKTTLNNSNFNYTKFINSTFEGAKLINATFYDSDGSESNFDEADVSGALFVFGRLLKTTWRKIKAQKIIFDKARLDDADFSNAQIDYTRFYHTELRGTSFEKAQVQFVDWRSADLLGAYFFKANCRLSNITLKQLQQTFSYDEAILSNGTKARETNLLRTVGAENNNGNCSTYGWNPDVTMVARPYAPNKVAASLGSCFFTGLEGATRATMRQRIKINSIQNRENSRLWIYGRCRELIPEDEFQVQIQLTQFDEKNNTLANNSLISSRKDKTMKYLYLIFF
jgi:uncharacterized protein YjbI with pentapeptide repeats